MTPKNPILHWILIHLTLGQYAFLWGFLIARDLNQFLGEDRFKLKKRTKLFSILYAVYAIGFASYFIVFINQVSGGSPKLSILYIAFFILLLVSLAILFIFLTLLIDVGKTLREIQKLDTPSTGSIVLLTFLYFISLPWFQSKLNKLVDSPKNNAQHSWWDRNWKWFVPSLVLGAIAVFVGFFMLIAIAVTGMMKSSEPYKEAIQLARSNPLAQTALGIPVEEAFFVTGSFSSGSSSGDADLKISLSGPSGEGTLYVVAKKEAGEWTYSHIILNVDRTNERIELIEIMEDQ